MKRFTRTSRCPICGGYENAERGAGKRCYGFVSANQEWANCTREEHSGLLDLNSSSKAYVHRLVGDCNCGKRHDPMPAKQITATYDYTDETGRLLYQVVRYEPKGFSQRKPDGDDWSWKLGDVRRVLFNLPAITNDIGRDQPVYVVEGEKDALTLIEHGFLATTNAGGAGKWKDEYTQTLRGRDVIIVPDHDEPGLDHANKVAAALGGIARSVKIVTPGENKDISEWFAQDGANAKEFQEIVDTVRPFLPGELPLQGVPEGEAQPQPQSAMDEKILLGTAINTPDIVPHLAAEMKVWHLADPDNQKIYKAMLAIDERGEIVDIPTLFNELQSNPSLQGSAITRAQIVALTVDLPVLALHTVQQSLKRLQEAAHLRYMLKLNVEVERRIRSGEHSAKDIYEFQNTSLDKLSVVTGVSQDFVSFAQMEAEMRQLINDLYEGKIVATSTGFKELDNILSWGGLIPKTTTILAAHTSFGKTALALDIAKRIAKQGFAVGIFSLEMGKESLYMRLHSNVSGLESHKIRPGMTNIERDILLQSMQEMTSLPIYVNDRITDVMQMRGAIRTFVRTHKNVGAIIVDYLQLAGVGTLRKDAQERERISEISRLMKQIASEFNVAIVELSQFSRESYKEGREPTVADLYGSGSIEKDADNIWFLHGERPDEIITIRELQFLFAKQRMGRLGRFGMKFDTARNKFISYPLENPNVESVERPIVVVKQAVVQDPDHPTEITDETGQPLF